MHSVGGGLVGGLSMAGGAPRPQSVNENSRHPRFTLEAGCTREASKVTSTAPETLDLHHKVVKCPRKLIEKPRNARQTPFPS